MIFTALVLLLGGARPPVRSLPTYVAGVSFAMTNDPASAYDSEAARSALDRLRGSGANAVSIMPFAFQRTEEADHLLWRLSSRRAETDAQVAAGIRAAKERGLFVLVKPQVWVPRSWPGAIRHRSEEEFRSWWADYRAYVMHEAELAAAAGADGFVLGTELSRLQRRSEWRGLAVALRQVFSGVLVYAANWDALDVPFADQLDALGVDLYEPLSSDPRATDADLARGARSLVSRLDARAKALGRPVLLTEAGFAARPACWTRPNEEGGDVDVEAQRRATRALLFALESSTSVKGVFWWKFFSDGREARSNEASFRVAGRPAERELFGFFARKAAILAR